MYYANDSKHIEHIVISDCRFPNEFEQMVKVFSRLNTSLIKVSRNTSIISDNHASETSIEQLVPDFMIYNNGDFDDLYKQCDRIMELI